MARLIIGHQNNYSYVFTPSVGTLVIKGILNWSIVASPTPLTNQNVQVGSIASIWDVTNQLQVPLSNMSVAKTFDTTTQIPIYTITWTTLPAGFSNGDTLAITVNTTYECVMLSLLEYQKA